MSANIYLDIDGVLLANDLNPANHANEFLRYVLGRYPDTTYWLTTHCNGDPSVPVSHIGHLFEADVHELMKKIKPTKWETAKTRGIDFSQPFLWFDDDLFYEEKQTLIQHNALDNWVEVNLTKNENQLRQFINSFPEPINQYLDINEIKSLLKEFSLSEGELNVIKNLMDEHTMINATILRKHLKRSYSVCSRMADDLTN